MAADTGGGVTAGVVAFAVFAVGFFAICAAIIWRRAHADATRVAAYFEDDSMPVRSAYRSSLARLCSLNSSVSCVPAQGDAGKGLTAGLPSAHMTWPSTEQWKCSWLQMDATYSIQLDTLLCAHLAVRMHVGGRADRAAGRLPCRHQPAARRAARASRAVGALRGRRREEVYPAQWVPVPE